MIEQSNLKKLIQKVSSTIPEIQVRSLSNIYTKLANQLITPEELFEFPQFPGMLMSWINDNKKKSDTLLKVIYIISFYCRIDKGLLLLRQYQCLEFCEQFKIYLLQNQRGIDAFTQELQAIIRSLLPLGRADESSHRNTQNLKVNSEEVNIKQAQTRQKTVNKGPKNISKDVKQTFKFKCQVLPLDEPQDKIIFQLLMKAKYANKDTIYLTLIQIRTFVSHYMVNSFRCKPDLFAQCFSRALIRNYFNDPPWINAIREKLCDTTLKRTYQSKLCQSFTYPNDVNLSPYSNTIVFITSKLHRY